MHYYQKLERDYGEPKTCFESIKDNTFQSYKEKIALHHATDSNSKLGTYLQVNPSLSSYVPDPQKILELERELTTRFRTGSHSLAIETGRYSNIPRENRICSCGTGVQTVWHVFAECPLTRSIVQKEYANVNEIFEDENVHQVILSITKKLKVQMW